MCSAAIAVLGLVAPNAGAELQIDYCAGATARVSTAIEREARLDAAIDEVSSSLEAAFALFSAAGPAVASSVPPVPLGRPEGGRQLKRKFFNLTVLHWLTVKQTLCRCPGIGEPPPTACTHLAEEVARSCELEPRRLHGINVRCLTKDR